MRKDKLQVIELRKQGLSYNEISRKLSVPKSTLSCWLSDIELSQKAKDRISARVHEGSIAGLLKRNKNQTILAQKRANEIRRLAKIETLGLLSNKLFLTGISLYWAEGYKKGAYGSKWKAVDFANSDPDLVRIMMKFFRKVCRVEDNKIKIQLIAHKNVNIKKAIRFWSNLTKIPENQFIKTCCAVSIYSKGKRNGNSLTHGTVHIRINNVKLFFRIIGWIDGLKLKI
ncbi:MAG: helix-turn-helix domain containing protein [Candidatus Moranbacteria bacterium]|nr:helix-turn-helix domain containing protein [Candidatus Moranbacteria bacterium]